MNLFTESGDIPTNCEHGEITWSFTFVGMNFLRNMTPLLPRSLNAPSLGFRYCSAFTQAENIMKFRIPLSLILAGCCTELVCCAKILYHRDVPCLAPGKVYLERDELFLKRHNDS